MEGKGWTVLRWICVAVLWAAMIRDIVRAETMARICLQAVLAGVWTTVTIAQTVDRR